MAIFLNKSNLSSHYSHHDGRHHHYHAVVRLRLFPRHCLICCGCSSIYSLSHLQVVSGSKSRDRGTQVSESEFYDRFVQTTMCAVCFGGYIPGILLASMCCLTLALFPGFFRIIELRYPCRLG